MRYRIRDNETGKSVVVSGDSPPSEAEAAQIIKDAGLKKKSVEGFVSNIGENAINTGKGIAGMVDTYSKPKENGKPWTMGGVEADVIKNMIKGTVSDAGEFIKDPVDFVYERPVDTALYAIPATKYGKGAAKTAKSTVGTVLSPKKTAGKLIEKRAASAGEVPPEMFEKYFGTVRRPNENLYRGLSPASGESILEQLLRKEIANQGISPGGVVPNPTYSDILNYRKGSYSAGKAAKGTSATPEQRLYQNMGKAYSQMLKEGAGTGGPDKIFNMLSKVDSKTKGTAGYLTKYVIPTYLFYKLFGGK